MEVNAISRAHCYYNGVFILNYVVSNHSDIYNRSDHILSADFKTGLEHCLRIADSIKV